MNSEPGNAENGLEKLFKRIVSEKSAFFRSQQKNEPELTDEEKYEIVSKLYVDKPPLFLSRYSNFMSKNDCQWFKCYTEEPGVSSDSGEIDFYLKKLNSSSQKSYKNKVKNRRYAYLKHLIEKTDYFSDYEMRKRHPLLFEQMIGKYQSENEMRQSFHSGSRKVDENCPLSTILLDFYDTKLTSQKREQEKTAEHLLTKMNVTEEEVSDLSETDEESCDESNKLSVQTSKQDKDHLREMFLHEMYENFLNGEDVDFDYRQIDSNEDYDLMDMVEKDEQDKYFDDD